MFEKVVDFNFKSQVGLFLAFDTNDIKQMQGTSCKLVVVDLEQPFNVTKDPDCECVTLKCEMVNLQSEPNFEEGLYLDNVISF